jgi:hypothetical protein
MSYKEVKVEQLSKVTNHKHNGIDARRIRVEDLAYAPIGTVLTEPTEAPTRFIDNFKLLNDGDGSILYVWDNDNEEWLKFNYYTS